MKARQRSTPVWQIAALKAAVIVALASLAAWSEHAAWAAGVHRALSEWTAASAGLVMQAAGLPTYTDGAKLHGLGYAVNVVPSCNGLVAFVLVGMGSLLLDAPWRRRIVALVASTSAVFVLNAVRIGTIAAIGTRSVPAARTVHEVVFPVVSVLLFVYLWYVWLERETAQAPQRSAP